MFNLLMFQCYFGIYNFFRYFLFVYRIIFELGFCKGVINVPKDVMYNIGK